MAVAPSKNTLFLISFLYKKYITTPGPQLVRVTQPFSSYRYSAVFETDGHPVTDGFQFSVSDMDDNRVDNQVFTILVIPAENPPHIIAFADLITVNSSDQ